VQFDAQTKHMFDLTYEQMFDSVRADTNKRSVGGRDLRFLSHPGGMFASWAQAHRTGPARVGDWQIGDQEETRMISQRSTSARALVIISMTVAAFVLLLATAVHAMTGGDPLATDDYRVHAGDTLWSIATEAITPDGDVRAMISTIQGLNDLPTSVIRVGEVLEIPSAPES
jgi:hypothetical protein